VLGPTFPNRLFYGAGTAFGRTRTAVDAELGLAPPNSPNIYKALSDAGVTWKEYSTDLAPSLLFGVDTTGHSGKTEDFINDLNADTLPQVSFLNPAFTGNSWIESDEHPPADMQIGQHLVWQQVDALLKSKAWKTSAMFVTYDENGGLYDHVPPPSACKPDDIPPVEDTQLGGFDRLGFRVPVFVISPWAKRHFVSHTVHSHTSILRFVEAKFGLPAFTARDANSDAMLDFFDFQAAPNYDMPAFAEPAIDPAQIAKCKKDFPGIQSPGDAGVPDAGH
jgi:phospholipase C